MDIKITDKIYKLYVTDIDADSYHDRISKWFESVIIPNVGDDIVLDIDDWGLKGNEYKVVRVVYPLLNLDYKVNIYVSKIRCYDNY